MDRSILESFVRVLMILMTVFLPLMVYSYPKVNTFEHNYIVEVKDKRSLLSKINKVSPIRDNDEIYHAGTETFVYWHVWWTKKRKECKLNHIETWVTIVYTLPRLSPKSQDAQVKKIWDKYYPALVEHEKGHAQIAIDGALEIEDTLKSMPAFSNCNILNDKANEEAQKILDKLSERHELYDQVTNHGETQGAYLNLYL